MIGIIMNGFVSFFLFSCLCLLSFVQSFAQDILVVNNRVATSTENTFNDLQDAINSATEGDIIHVIPSASPYGSALINKSITIYGIGVNHQIHERRSIVGNIQLNATNGRLKDISISGLVFDNLEIIGPAENVQIKQNELKRIYQSDGSQKDVYIIQNVLTSFSFADEDLQNVVVANNVFNIPFNGTNTFSSTSEGPLLIYNNLYVTNSSSASSFNPAFKNLNASVVQGNIFYNVSPNPSQVTNTLFSNNLSFLSSNPEFPPSTNGNESINNVINQDPRFVNLPPRTFWAFTLQLDFQEDSPALNSGMNGEPLGPANGYYPWNPESSPLPYIDDLEVELQDDGSIRVRLNAKSGN